MRWTAALVRCTFNVQVEGGCDDVHHPINLVNVHRAMHLMYTMFPPQPDDVHRTRVRMFTKRRNVRSEFAPSPQLAHWNTEV